jgi:hypothetical protein
MSDDVLNRLARAPGVSTWLLTLLSCALAVVSVLTRDPLVVTLLAVSVPLTLTAAIQVMAVAPLAAELRRLRDELARSRA